MSVRSGWSRWLKLGWLALAILQAEAAFGVRQRSSSGARKSVKEHAQVVRQDLLELRRENRRLQFSNDDLDQLNSMFAFGNCSENVFKQGYIDIRTVLYNCEDNIPSPQNPPSYFTRVDGTHGPMKVFVQVNLASLLEVDDIQGTNVISFFLRMLWADPRLIINAWPYLHPNVSTEGIELVSYVRNEGDPLSIWLPDVFFADSLEMDVTDETIKLLPDGVLYWSRHFVGEFAQDKMTFHDYPTDSQRFAFTLQSFGYSSTFVELAFLQNMGLRHSGLHQNEIWTFQSSEAVMTTINVQEVTGNNQDYSSALLTATFSRQSRGIVYRLALPVMIFLVVVGASFWAVEEQRIDITLQVLLLVSTLYIVIGQSIPFVGYLTMMDNYIITVFVLLAITVSIHFLVATLTRKAGKYPMAGFLSYLLVLFFRVSWIPMSVAMFTRYFQLDLEVLLSILAVLVCSSLLYCRNKIGSVGEKLKQAVLKLRMKEDLVNLQAVDDSGQPVRLSQTEQAVLYCTEVWYQDAMYKQLLFSSDLALLVETEQGGEEAEEGEKEKLKVMTRKEEWGEAKRSPSLLRRSLSRSSSRNERGTGMATSPGRKEGGSDLDTMLKALHRHQSLQIQRMQSGQTASRALVSNDEECKPALGEAAEGSETDTAQSLGVKVALREFKICTLAEMGIYLPAAIHKPASGTG